MSTRRDYVPSREKNLAARMKQGGSIADGLAGQTVVQKDGAHYRTYRNADGSFNASKRYTGTNDSMDWGMGEDDS